MVCYLGRVCLTYICTRSALDRTLTTCITASLIRLTRCQRLGAFESTTSRLLMFNRSLLAPEVLLGVDSNARCVLRSDRALFELVHFNQIVAHAQPPFCWTASHTLLIELTDAIPQIPLHFTWDNKRRPVLAGQQFVGSFIAHKNFFFRIKL